jgi:ribosome assembly protein YihI (activator of Der GTPase)
MEDHKIYNIEDFLEEKNISVIEVIGNKKKEDIEIIDAQDFLDVLCKHNLVDDDELNEGLQMFFAISVDIIDKLMIRKMK